MSAPSPGHVPQLQKLRTFALENPSAVILLLLAVVGAGVYVFIQIAEEVLEGDTTAFDTWLLLALRDPADHQQPIGPAWFVATVEDVTALGSTFTLAFVTLAVTGWLVLSGKRHAAALLAVAVVGGTILSQTLKSLFDRPRPDLVAHGVDVFTASFPSGHAMLSAVTYLTLAAMIMRVSKRRSIKLYVLVLAVLLTTLIGVSRLFLGVHWPTDVLAGWSIGAAWALLVWTVALWLQARGKVEGEDDVRGE